MEYTDSDRLKFLIETKAYVKNTWKGWRVFEVFPYTDDEDMNRDEDKHETPQEAIDAAIERFK